MLFVLSVLIVTTTSLFGLLSLWAATSPRHWFLRTACVGGVLSLLLLIPAYELLVCFGIQAALVFVVVAMQRGFVRWKDRRSDLNLNLNALPSDTVHHRPRFSLQTLLLVIVVLAALVTVGMGLPKLEWVAWVIVAGMGAQAAVQTLMAAWLLFGNTRKWLRLPLAGLIPVLSLVALSHLFDALVPSSSPLPQPFGESVLYLLNLDWVTRFMPEVTDDWVRWSAALCVCLVDVALSTALLALFAAGGLTQHLPLAGGVLIQPTEVVHRRYRRQVARIGAVGLALLLTIFPVGVYWRLLHPTPIPSVSLPVPNGYEALIEAGRLLKSPILDNSGAASPDALRGEVTKYQHVFDLVQLGLSRDCRKPLRYDLEDLNVHHIHVMRSVGRAICGAGHVSKADENFGQAARHYMNAVRLGPAGGSGGLMVDALVGVALEGIGMNGLWKLTPQLSNVECRELVDALLAVDVAWETADQILSRDRIWSEHAYGWQGCLEIAILELWPDEYFGSDRGFVFAMLRTQTMRRLLAVNFAIRAFQLENRRSPKSLDELIPNYLPEVPRDPFGDGPLVYRCEADKFVLYSIGQDGIDDGGKRLARLDEFSKKSGDLCLESFFDYGDAKVEVEQASDPGIKTE